MVSGCDIISIFGVLNRSIGIALSPEGTGAGVQAKNIIIIRHHKNLNTAL